MTFEKRIGAYIFIILALFATGGCTSLRHASNDMGKWVSDPLMPPMTAPVDLISLLSEGERTTDESKPFVSQFEKEVKLFNSTSGVASPAKRNLLQDRLKVSADQLCDDYKANIMRKQARSNFWLGTASLFLGSAGALTKSVDAARALAGGSAFATGVRSEYNQDFFLDQTVAVIAKAIDQKQSEIIGVVQAKRTQQLAEYSIIQAIDDMSRYHAACSLAGALSLTEKAVQTYDVTKAVKDAIAASAEYKKLGTVPAKD